MPIKHPFVSGRDDGGDPGAVQPSGWNAEHQITGMLALLDALANLPNMVLAFDGSGIPYLKPVADFATSVDANLAGTPTAPTAAPGTNTTQIATTAFVKAAIDAILAGAPGALDTLYELAAALGNDANFAAVVNAAIALRLRVDVAQGLSLAQKSQGRDNLGLGTAAVLDTGTTANKIVQLDGTAKLPAVDGSQLTNIPGSSFLQAGTGAVSRTMQNKARDIVSVKDFGAVCDGTTDDTAAVQAAVTSLAATGGVVTLPAAQIKITGVITIANSFITIEGAGRTATVITSSSAGHSFVVNNGLTGVSFKKFKLTRTTSAGSSQNGIHFTGLNETVLLDDVLVANHYNNFRLGTTSYSYVHNCFGDNAYNNNFHVTNADGAGGCQWTFFKCLAQTANGFGLYVEALTANMSVGDILDFSTYANKLGGAKFVGNGTFGVNAIRWIGGIVGEDGKHGIMLDTYGTATHHFHSIVAEIAGTAACGRNYSTPATNQGNGFNVTANNTAVVFCGCSALGNSWSGLESSALLTTVSGGEYRLNGAAGLGGETSGIQIGAGEALINGVLSTAQVFGVFTTVDSVAITGNDLDGNSSGAVGSSVTLNSSVVTGNKAAGSYGQIPATRTNDNALATKVGEYMEGVLAAGSAVSVASGTPKTIAQITLTPGDWDVSGMVNAVTATTTSVNGYAGSLSTTTNAIDTSPGKFSQILSSAFAPGNGSTLSAPLPAMRFSVATNTTVFLVAFTIFSVSSMTAYGIIRARRVR